MLYPQRDITEDYLISVIQFAADGLSQSKLVIGIAAAEAERLFGTTAREIGRRVNGLAASTIRNYRRVVVAYGRLDEGSPSWLQNARAEELCGRPGVYYTHLRTALELPTIVDAIEAIDRIPSPPEGGDLMTDEQFRRLIGLKTKTHTEWTPVTANARLGVLASHAEEIVHRIMAGYWPMAVDDQEKARALANRIITDVRELESVLDRAAACRIEQPEV